MATSTKVYTSNTIEEISKPLEKREIISIKFSQFKSKNPVERIEHFIKILYTYRNFSLQGFSIDEVYKIKECLIELELVIKDKSTSGFKSTFTVENALWTLQLVEILHPMLFSIFPECKQYLEKYGSKGKTFEVDSTEYLLRRFDHWIKLFEFLDLVKYRDTVDNKRCYNWTDNGLSFIAELTKQNKLTVKLRKQKQNKDTSNMTKVAPIINYGDGAQFNFGNATRNTNNAAITLEEKNKNKTIIGRAIDFFKGVIIKPIMDYIVLMLVLLIVFWLFKKDFSSFPEILNSINAYFNNATSSAQLNSIK